jgi:hypothetical protein
LKERKERGESGFNVITSVAKQSEQANFLVKKFGQKKPAKQSRKTILQKALAVPRELKRKEGM